MVNAYQIKKFGDMDLRKAKTDKKDAVRIARYALEKSYSLVPYTSMEQKYEDLRFLARQYNQRMLTLKTNKVFLLNLLDETIQILEKHSDVAIHAASSLRHMQYFDFFLPHPSNTPYLFPQLDI